MVTNCLHIAYKIKSRLEYNVFDMNLFLSNIYMYIHKCTIFNHGGRITKEIYFFTQILYYNSVQELGYKYIYFILMWRKIIFKLHIMKIFLFLNKILTMIYYFKIIHHIINIFFKLYPE